MKEPNKLPSVNYLRECWRYDRRTGKLYWRVRPLAHFIDRRICNSWNAKNSGNEAGKRADGYVHIRLNGVTHLAHRLVWKIIKGKEPPRLIDHRNTDGYDNRIGNLRSANHNKNTYNASLRNDNTSGVKGVSWQARGKWRASLVVDGVYKHLGYFDALEDATRVIRAARRKLHKEFARH